MDYQHQQPALSRAAVQPAGLHHHPGRRVQPGRRRGPLGRRQPGQPGWVSTGRVHPPHQPRRCRSRWRHCQLPSAVVVQPGPQHVMVTGHRLQCPVQVRQARPGRHRHQHRLTEPGHRPAALQQPPHHRGRRNLPGTNVRDSLPGWPRRFGDGGQRGRGAGLEYVPRAEHQPRRPRPGDQLHRHDAVPAQVEEPVLGPDPLYPQQTSPNSSHSTSSAAVAGPRPPAAPVNCGGRQRRGVQLAVHRDRQHLQRDDRGRDHVLRQPPRHILPQLRSVYRLLPGG